MNNYSIQLKLHMLAYCGFDTNSNEARFAFDGLEFEHWDFSLTNGYKTGAWLVKREIQADDYKKAHELFREKLHHIIPKIAFISQCFTEYLGRSYLIHKKDTDIAYFQYSKEVEGSGVFFLDKHLEALTILSSENCQIPKAFFYYWNDMINTTGYSAKLLLLCAAIDSLAPNQQSKKAKRVELLGKTLADKIFMKDLGVRHRLSHGEYFSQEIDRYEDYLSQSYEQIIIYFNKKIFSKDLINLIKNPQRNPYDNKVGYKTFIKKINSVDKSTFNLKDLVNGCDKEGIHYINDYHFLGNKEVPPDY